MLETDIDAVPEQLLYEPSPDRAPCTAADLNLPNQMDGDGPLISVLIPTYEDQYYLPDALESVGNQSCDNIELILIDSSGINWIERLATDREWIRYRSQEPKGISKARNDGIEIANGQYIALLDADDYWYPEKLDRQLTSIEAAGRALSYSAYYYLNIKKNDKIYVKDAKLSNPEHAWRDRIQGKIFAIPSTLLFRRSKIPHRPFNESLDACEDFAFLIDQFIKNPPDHIPDPLTVKRSRPRSITDDREEMFKEKQKAIDYLLRRHSSPELRKVLKREQIRNKRKLGQWYRDNGQKKRAGHCLAEAEITTGRQQLKNNENEAASRHFEKALTLAPDNAKGELHQRIGQLYLDHNNTMARRHFIASIRAAGLNPITIGSLQLYFASFRP